jgi:hypothetical protein
MDNKYYIAINYFGVKGITFDNIEFSHKVDMIAFNQMDEEMPNDHSSLFEEEKVESGKFNRIF